MNDNEFFEFDLFSLEPPPKYPLDNIFGNMETAIMSNPQVENEIELFSSEPSSIDPLQEGETVNKDVDDAIISLFKGPKQLDIRLHSSDNKWSEVITIVVNDKTTIADVRAYLMQRVADIQYSFYVGKSMSVYALDYLNVRMNMTLHGLQQKKWKIKVHIYILQQHSFMKRMETVQLSLHAPMQALYRLMTRPENMVYEIRNHAFQSFTSNISNIKHVLWGKDALDFNINILAYNDTVRIFPSTFQSLEKVLAYAMQNYVENNRVRLPINYHPNNPPPSTWKRDVIQADLAFTFPNVPFELHTSSTNEIFIMPKAVNVAFIPYCLEEAIALPPQGYREVSLTTAFSDLLFVSNHENINEFIVLGAPDIDPVTIAQILEELLRNKSNTILRLTIYIVYKMWTTPIDPKTVLFTLDGKAYTYQDYFTRKRHNILLHQPPYSSTKHGQSFLKHFETAYKTKLACLM